MKIALDATPLIEPTGGVRRYTTELAQALSGSFPEDEIWLLSDQRIDANLPELRNARLGLGPQSAFGRRWWLWGLGRELSRIGADVFHGVDFSVPYLPARPSVMTVHDLSPWRQETATAASRRVRRRAPLLIGLGAATIVITPTQAIRNEVIDSFRIHPDRVAAIHLAASDWFRPTKPPTSAPYFLYAGALEPRKNIGIVIEAWRELTRTQPVELWLAGRVRGGFKAPAEPGLHLIGAVEDKRLPELYSGAVACLYPSLYEGFGLPVLEAMQCGAMVIASRDRAITEVAANAASQADARDPRAWLEAMRAALDPEIRRSFQKRSLNRAAEFSWNRTARLTREVYEEARRRF